MTQRAVVLVSGGLDSATTLAIARHHGLECYALSVDYGQRHRAELLAAERIARSLGAVEHRTMRIDLGGIGGSALTDPSLDVPEAPQIGIPITYVPARNTVMLALALGWAEVLGASQIHIGVNAVDYSGYPDCRPAFIEAFERVANLATKAAVEGTMAFRIVAPLVDLTKAQIIRRAGGRLWPDRFLLPGRRRWPSVRPLRRMPVAARRVRRCRGTGPDALLPMNYADSFGIMRAPRTP
jgi:7-cyano-7-deazaguanine synthase